MKLYIIGNGFDRAHHLPTRYWDFRTYLAQHYPDFLSLFEENYDIKTIIPVDMFPWTSHVECCSLLEIKQSVGK